MAARQSCLPGEGAARDTEVSMNPPLRIHPTRESSIRHAREMRKAPSDAERRLWSCLRNRQLGNFKFRRQHPIGPFIVDFCCIEKSLVIELDGEQHLTAEQYDGRRSEFLAQRGYRVIRFWNSAVLTGIEAVLEQVQIDLSRSVGGARSTLTRSARLSPNPQSDNRANRPLPRKNAGEEE